MSEGRRSKGEPQTPYHHMPKMVGVEKLHVPFNTDHLNFNPNKDKPLDKISRIVDWIQDDMEYIERVEKNRLKQIEYIEKSLRKIITVRSESFAEHVKSLIKSKDSRIKEMTMELSKMNILKSENEMLKKRIRELENMVCVYN